jgi:hypothetical protein
VTRKWLFLKRKWEHDPKAEWELRNGRCVRRILLPSVFPSHETRGTGLPSVLLGWKWGQKTESLPLHAHLDLIQLLLFSFLLA